MELNYKLQLSLVIVITSGPKLLMTVTNIFLQPMQVKTKKALPTMEPKLYTFDRSRSSYVLAVTLS